VLKILIDGDDDRVFVVYNNGLSLVYDAIYMLHVMYHEATACHITMEIIELVNIFAELLRAFKAHVDRNGGGGSGNNANAALASSAVSESAAQQGGGRKQTNLSAFQN
jgi:hypothetical protein